MVSKNRRYNARAGFSLIEIVAVILLIGILAAGAAVAVLPQVARARVKATENSMRTIRTSINSYMVEHAAPPPTLQAMIGQYLEEGSDLDAWGTPYYYRVTTGAARPFELVSAGPDADFGTPEDNIDLWAIQTGN